MASVQQEPTPPLPTIDVILFAVNEDTPRLIKVPYKDDGLAHFIQTPGWYLERESFRTQSPVNNRLTPTRKRPVLFIEYDDMFAINGSELNRCIQTASGGKAPAWRGTVFGVRAAPSYRAGVSEKMANAVLEEDLPEIMDCLTSWVGIQDQVRWI